MKRIILRDCEASAFYAGRLTQLMRPVKTTRATGTICGPAAELGYAIQQWGGGKWNIASHTECIPCPLGGVGSRLWVAETWAPVPGGPVTPENGAIYRAFDEGNWSWRSPVTMPRWASRAIIELTAVRVKRVQWVTEEEARKCGVGQCALATDTPSISQTKSTQAFIERWIADHGQASWDANPWVWVRDVRRVEK